MIQPAKLVDLKRRAVEKHVGAFRQIDGVEHMLVGTQDGVALWENEGERVTRLSYDAALALLEAQ